MNVELVHNMLGFQPFTGLCNTSVLKFQAHPVRHPNDTTTGWYYEVFGRRKDQTEKSSWSPSSLLSFNATAQWFLLGYQAIEGPIAVLLTRLLCQYAYAPLVLGRPMNEEKIAAIESHRSSLWRASTAGYFVTNTIVLLGVSMVSHPFSLVRTHYLVSGHLPSMEGFWHNLTGTWAGDKSLYWRTIHAHLLMAVSDLWMYGLVYRGYLAIGDHILERYNIRKEIEDNRRALTESQKLLASDIDKERLRIYRWARIKRIAIEAAVKIAAQFTTRSILFPLFTVRARLEAQRCDFAVAGVNVAEKLPQFSGWRQCAQQLYDTEGVAGFYRGFPTHLWGFALQGVYMGIVTGVTYGCIRSDVWEDEQAPTQARPRYPVS